MQNCKPINIHVAKGESLSHMMRLKTLEERDQMDCILYSNVVGSLIYAMMCTRPNICYTVELVSRYQFNLGPIHWKATKRILRYLKGIDDYMLCYQSSNFYIIGYTNANWSGDIDWRKFTSGYVFLLNRGVISSNSKRKSCVALSKMEVGFMACTTTM